MKKTQVLIVHGGEVHNSDESFYEMLKSWTVNPYETSSKSWKANLQEDLGDSFEVIRPAMPNKMKADYHAWKIWFEKYCEYLNSEKNILIGHSLGGLFLAKYLSENKFPQDIYSLYFVAPVFDHGVDKELGNFRLNLEKLFNISKQCSQIYLYHSTDDNVVPFNHSREYHTRIEGSKLTELENRGHINQEHFEELVEKIKNNK